MVCLSLPSAARLASSPAPSTPSPSSPSWSSFARPNSVHPRMPPPNSSHCRCLSPRNVDPTWQGPLKLNFSPLSAAGVRVRLMALRWKPHEKVLLISILRHMTCPLLVALEKKKCNSLMTKMLLPLLALLKNNDQSNNRMTLQGVSSTNAFFSKLSFCLKRLNCLVEEVLFHPLNTEHLHHLQTLRQFTFL